MFRTLSILSLVLLAGCAGRNAKPVEDLSGGRDLSRFTLTSIQGTRDGDRMDALAIYSGGQDQLRVELHIAVGAQSHLALGKWSGLGGEGTVRERALTFLGGQSGPPSLGGNFDLLGVDGVAKYRVVISLAPVEHRL